MNPHKRTCQVPGEPQRGDNNPCRDILRSNTLASPLASELAPMQGPTVQSQLVDTILSAWHMLDKPVFTEFPSLPIAFVMQDFLPTDAAAFRKKFIADVMVVLGPRFEGTVRIVVVDGPSLCPASPVGRPDMLGQLLPGAHPSTCVHAIARKRCVM